MMRVATSSGDVSFAASGAGPPVLLVHGFPIDGRIWDGVVPALAESHRVVVPDLPGFGQSSVNGAFTMDSLAGSLVELLDHLKLGRAAFAGLSMGGYVIQALVRNHPDRVAALSFVDTKASADDDAGRAARDKMIALVNEEGTAGVVEQMLPKMLAPATFDSRPEVVARLREIMSACPPRTIEFACAAMRDRADFTAELSRLKCPLQIIVGEHDAIAPPDVARAMHAAAAGSRLDVIAGAGHMAPLEQPESVARAIGAWLEGVTP